AIAYLLTEARVRQNTYLEAIGRLIEYQNGLMEQSAQAAATSYQTARSLMLTIGAAALLLAVGIAFWITRSITRPVGEAVAVAARLAEGDLTARIAATSRDEVGQLLAAMQAMVGRLTQVIAEVRGAADALSGASEEVAATAQSMSQAAAEQAASVEETSSSIEQMTASINQNAENAKVTDGMASKAAHEAAAGGEAVRETVAAMKSIAEKI